MKKLLMIIGGLCAMSAYSDDIVAPAMPPSDCDDTEAVTNVALPAVRADPADRLLRQEHPVCDADTLGKRDGQ